VLLDSLGNEVDEAGAKMDVVTASLSKLLKTKGTHITHYTYTSIHLLNPIILLFYVTMLLPIKPYYSMPHLLNPFILYTF
jgi:hypothetical protein